MVTGRVRQVVVLYSNDRMGNGLGGLSVGRLRRDEWSFYKGGRLSSFDSKYTNTYLNVLTRMKTKKKKRQKSHRSGHLPELLYSCNYHQAW